MSGVITWSLIAVFGALVSAIVWAALRAFAWAEAVCADCPPPVRIRRVRGRDGVLRVYRLIRRDADEWYPG